MIAKAGRVRLVALAALLAMTGCPRRVEKPPEVVLPTPTADADEYPVFEAVLRKRLVDPELRRLVLRPLVGFALARTTAAIIKLEEKSPDLEQQAIREFLARNETPALVEPRIALALPVEVRTREVLAAYFNREKCEAGWQQYRADHYDAKGLLQLSRVGFNHDRTQAIVLLAWQSTCLNETGTVYELLKRRGDWKVVLRATVWTP